MAIRDQIQDEPNELFHEQNRLERIKKYIDDNLKGNLGAAIVAKKFELSVSSLLHIFKKHEQQTYQHYLENVRMKKAMELIKAGKWIQEIMDATGYKYRSTFHKAFKRKFKHPPGYFGK
jgi:AraC-like DNA-binding protein